MPRCGSQITLCDLPIRFDTYKGCSHACKYCFVKRKIDIANIETDESAVSLLNFIRGGRNQETKWCDWGIPIHWGGVSDPFQPAEKIHKRSLEALNVFAETGHPFVVSTKGALIAKEPYYSLIGKCNCVLQVSLVSPQYDRLEEGAPCFSERLGIVRKLCKLDKRVIIRVQPYVPNVFKDVLTQIPLYADAGVYGITVEGMKYQRQRPGLIKIGGDFVFPEKILKQQFEILKAESHKHGLKFFCAENRLRSMGDSLCCCGAEGVKGFVLNKFNLNHFLYDKENYKPTQAMMQPGTAAVFKAIMQDTIGSIYLKKSSLHSVMSACTKDLLKLQTLGYKPQK